jgi:hypothetical protein
MGTVADLPYMTRAGLRSAVLLALLGLGACPIAAAADVPRLEHPTPDAVRPHWANLNGPWQFRFDPSDEGVKAGWEKPGAPGFEQTIVVPFPWESELSGVHKPGVHGVAWYRREFTVPSDFPRGDRVWLRFGAVDWRADVWVNGRKVAEHEGGYTPFEADVTDALNGSSGKPAVVVVRAFDPTDPSLPTGKQVGWYTTTSGIWQTVWLESRPKARIDRWTVKTEVDPPLATFDVRLAGVSPGKYTLSVKPKTAGARPAETTVEVTDAMLKGPDSPRARVEVTFEESKFWTPESPHLYEVTLGLKGSEGSADTVDTYFGLRTISRGKYGDAPYERILLNGKPVYLRLALDQSFNPEGVYTAPSDDFLKTDMVIAKLMGLNGLRVHIKPDEPRRLYWADRVGLLILEDMPNTWRQNARAREAWESTMREAVARDINHPSIVTWVAFNETWGLGSAQGYKRDADTQKWVDRMVSTIRKLDPTRLVEDNSPCNYDHVENTDLNSWHFYIDDHAGAERHIAEVVEKTEPGSPFNYCEGQKQGTAPLINSEYGGVSAGGGDRDVSWAFRDLTTLIRRQPKIQGYVYTELTDIEWEHNGFANYDRTPKQFGYDAFIPDMRPNELNGPDFVGYGGPPVRVVKPGEQVTVPVFVSHFSDLSFQPALRWWVDGWDDEANSLMVVSPTSRPAIWKRYDVEDLEPITFRAPGRPFVGSVNLTLRDPSNRRVTANFVNLVVKLEKPLPRVERRDDHEVVLRFAPGDFARRRWSGPAASPEGKVYGRGKGYFEYRLKLPADVVKAGPDRFFLRLEAASKAGREKVDWPSRTNPQDYPQTDTRKWPSTLEISLNGRAVDRTDLEDDPADARGVLSHLKRSDHGSYGELIEVDGDLPRPARDDLAGGEPLVLRLAVPDDAGHAGGLCLFGAESGRYPFDPTLVITTRDRLPLDLGVDPDVTPAVDRMSARVSVVLPSGEASAPAEWSYTTTDPGAGWTEPGFDSSGWKSGKAGFGTDGTPALRVGTRWDGDRIWLRTKFDVPALKPGDDLTLRLFHDEDAEVFVNGKRLLRTRGYVTSYRSIPLDDAQKALFREGSNTLAVSCRQTGGGQGIDVGVTLTRGE